MNPKAGRETEQRNEHSTVGCWAGGGLGAKRQWEAARRGAAAKTGRDGKIKGEIVKAETARARRSLSLCLRSHRAARQIASALSHLETRPDGRGRHSRG